MEYARFSSKGPVSSSILRRSPSQLPLQGDVEELLGSVPISNPAALPPKDVSPPTSLPAFPLNAEHPYHIVIV